MLDVEFVLCDGQAVSDGIAARLADAAGGVFAAPPGTTWVRLRPLARSCYAENGMVEPEGWNAIFVTVIKAHVPSGEALEKEVRALTEAVARICGREQQQVHVLYEPAAAGRIAFGGRIFKS